MPEAGPLAEPERMPEETPVRQSVFFTTLVQKLAGNITGYLIALVIGAIFVMLMQSGAKDARLAAVEKQADEQAQEIKEIQKELADGGPPALAQRVDALSQAIQAESAKLDRVLELVSRRGGQ